MTTIAQALRILPALAMLGCVSDFSPDPYKKNPNELPVADSGQDSGARTDAGITPRDSSVAPPADSGSMSSDSGPSMNAGPCDLSGRWIITEHNQSVAYGAEQVSNASLYVELTQQGTALTISKSLLCWTDTNEASKPAQIVAVHMSDEASWPAYQVQTNYNGRKGTSSGDDNGCQVDFEESPLVKGMTVATYRDPSVPLPTAMLSAASNGGVGWEDWDMDGQPGITMTVSKAADAHMYTSLRSYSTYTGMIAARASNFQIANNWRQDRVVYGSDNNLPFVTDLLGSNAGQSQVPNSSFVEWARLGDDQAKGDDNAICEAIRSLYATLTPTGSSH